MQIYRIKERRRDANHIKKGLTDNLEPAGSFAGPGRKHLQLCVTTPEPGKHLLKTPQRACNQNV